VRQPRNKILSALPRLWLNFCSHSPQNALL
jgi:hypothetical protein